MTSGSNCLHLNRPETDDARSIGPAYQTTPAKLQHCLIMSPEKETNLFLVFKTHTLQKVGKKDVFPVGKNLVDILLFEINIGHRGDLSAAHTGHQKRVLYLRNGAMHSHAA